MKTLVRIFLFLLIFLTNLLHAELIDNGNGTVTDTEKGIMWTKNALLSGSSSLTYNEAVNWVSNLNYAGYDDWRLPDGIDPRSDPNGSTEDNQYYYDCRNSEFGNLFYNELGGQGGWRIDQIFPGIPNPDPDLALFENILGETANASIFWTEIKRDADYTWTFCFAGGFYKAILSSSSSTYRLRAWAVRDISQVPNNPPQSLGALTGYHSSVPLAWKPPAGSSVMAKFTSNPDHFGNNNTVSQLYDSSVKLTPFDAELKTASPQMAFLTSNEAASPTGYNIYRSTSSGGSYTKIASNVTRQYYRDATATNGQTYYYKVTAVYTGGESGYSNIASAAAQLNGYIINSGWASASPALNGVINSSEWAAAATTNIPFPGQTGTVTFYVMNDNNYLYIAIDNQLDHNSDDSDGIGVFCDENFDRAWPASSPSGEGLIQLYQESGSQYNRYLGFYGTWPDQYGTDSWSTPSGVNQMISFSSGHMQIETSFDLMWSPFNASAGNNIGFLIYVLDATNGEFNGLWPQATYQLEPMVGGNTWAHGPFCYGDLKLASAPTTVPDIAVNPTSWNYGSINVGNYVDKTFVVKNEGTATLNISNITVEGDITQFSVESGGGSSSLAPGATRDVVVRFEPTSAGTKNVTAKIYSNDPDENPLLVNLSGTGTAVTTPDISSNPSSWNYGSVTVGSTSDKTFIITNEGTANLNVTATTLTGTNAVAFSILSGGGAFTLAPNATRDIIVRFSSTSDGSKSASLSISSNDPDENPLLVSLTGTGAAFVPIFPVAVTTQMASVEFWVNIDVGTSGNPVSNLFGVSFDLNYTQTDYIDVVTPPSSNVLAGSFLGSDVIFFPYVDETAGKVSIGISRKGGQGGVNGSGTVVQVKFVAKSTTPQGTLVQFTLSNIAANDPSGNAITLNPASLAVTIHAGLIVWPGDTDNNNVVNQADVLPIGLYWAKTGAVRTCHTNELQWIAHVATPWTQTAATYADANGDGTVNQSDVLPIGLNWGKTHSASALGKETATPQTTALTAPSKLLVVITGETDPGKDFYIDVVVKDVPGLFGLSYELVYTPQMFIDLLVVEEGLNNALGNDLVFFSMIDKNAGVDSGKISVGITRKYGQGGVDVDSGLVTQIKAHMSQTAVNLQSKTMLVLANIQANDAMGNAIPIDTSAHELFTAIETNPKNIPTAISLQQNYPNPFNPGTTIEFQIPGQFQISLAIYDLQGHEIRTLLNETKSAGHYSVNWDGRDEAGNWVASGIYFYKLWTNQFSMTRKCFLIK